MQLLAILKTLISLLPLIHSAILAVEQIVGPGSGATKLVQVVDVVSRLLPADDVAHAAAVKDLLPVAISAAVGIMNQNGTLPKPTTSAQASAG